MASPLADPTANAPANAPASEIAQPAQARNPLGPEQAAVQIVMFFDYECPRCPKLEREVRTLIDRFPDGVSLSLRHYPQSTDCNHTLKLNTHPSACRAARAAETAWIVNGEPGFWKMHAWLFQRMGRFSGDELRNALPGLGCDDVDHFLEVMAGEEPLERILRDVLDAATLRNVKPGTMVMNGVPLDGGEIDDAMAQAVRFLEGQLPAESVLALPGESSPQDIFSAELLATAAAATVQVLNVSNGDQGSGVVVGQRGLVVYVLTADHLLGDRQRRADDRRSADRGDRLEVRAFSAIADRAPAVYRSARVVARSPDDDLAVVSVSTRHDVPVALPICPPSRMPDDDEPFPALSVGWGGGAPTNVVGNVSAKKRVRKRSKGAATFMWELSKPSKPGQSGGPLIGRQGYVIGVASGNSGGHGYFCHTRTIHRLLEENGLEWLYKEKSEAAR